MKKILAIMMVLVMAVAFTACGGGEGSGDTDATTFTGIETPADTYTDDGISFGIPEGWKIVKKGEWKERKYVTVCEEKNQDDPEWGGDVYVEFHLYTDGVTQDSYDENMKTKEDWFAKDDYDDSNLVDWTFNDNVYQGTRSYDAVGDSALDMRYNILVGDKWFEIRAYTESGKETDENQEAIKQILASFSGK